MNVRYEPRRRSRRAAGGSTILLALALLGAIACGGTPSSGGGPSAGGASGAAGGGGGTGSGAGGASAGGSGGGGAGSGGAGGGAGAGTGGTSVPTDAGADAAGRGGAAGGSGGAGTGGTTGAGGAGSIAFTSERAILTGVRGLANPRSSMQLRLVNLGPAAVDLTALALEGDGRASFQISGPQLPAMLMPLAGVDVTVQLLSSGAGLPAAPAQDSGATVLTASLSAVTGGGAARVSLFGVVLTQALWEPTFGQILTTLGYEVNVGLAQNNANPNRGKTVQQLPGVEAGTDEIAAPLFVKAGAGNVTLAPVARFSPMGPLPFGWYPAGSSATRNVVGTMDQATDAQTSNKARMVSPPLAAGGATTFDPGSRSFGIWVYTDQLSQRYDTGTASYGDYDYSEDALNAPAGVHRVKVYPLKDAAGTTVANKYLLGIEEAANGDYQDFVFVLGNVRVAP